MAPSAPETGRVATANAPAPTTGESFLAGQLSDGDAWPPDTMGAVGPTQIMSTLNNRIKVFDKEGTLGGLNVPIETFFASVNEGGDSFDPQVEYDRLAERWIVAAINFGPGPGDTNNRIMLAVSSGPTITNSTSFTFFQFRHNEVAPAGDNNTFADYPQMGVDEDAVYIGVNNFSIAGTYVNSAGYVIRKSSVLGAGPIVVTAFRGIDGGGTGANAGLFAPQGVQNMTPGASAGYFVGVNVERFSRLVIRRVSNPGGTPTISGNLQVPVEATSFPLDVPADGSLRPLDAIDDRLFGAMINVDETGAAGLWTAHNIATNAAGEGGDTGAHNRTSSRWYEIGNLAGAPSLGQSGTLFDSFGPPNQKFFWIPTIAENGQGVATLGSSVSSANTFAGAAAAQRLPGDPLGTLGPHTVIQAGSASYNDPFLVQNPTFQRWGDYSQTVVDPTDDQTFWTFQEYVNSTDNWAVRAVQIKAPPPATPSASSPVGVPPGDSSVDVTITGIRVNGSAFFDPGPGFPKRIGATVSGGVAVNDVDYVNRTRVVLDLDTRGAPTGAKNVTITNPDGQSRTGAGVLRVQPPPDTTPPETTITKKPKRKTTRRKARFKFVASEAESTFECKLDRKRWRPCTSPFKKKVKRGKHKFKVRATDRAGNTDPTPAKRKWKVKRRRG